MSGPSRHPHFTMYVLELVKLLQASLAICGMFPLPPPHTPATAFDGLLCDVTIDGLRRWVAEIGDSLISSEVSSYLNRYNAYRAHTRSGAGNRAYRRSQCDRCAALLCPFDTQQACSLGANHHQGSLSPPTRVFKRFVVLGALCEQRWHTDARFDRARAARELEYREWKRKHPAESLSCHTEPAIRSSNHITDDKLTPHKQPLCDTSSRYSPQHCLGSGAYPHHLPHAHLAQVVAFPTGCQTATFRLSQGSSCHPVETGLDL